MKCYEKDLNELICKPGSVLLKGTIIHLAIESLQPSCDLPVNSNEQFSNVHTIAISCNLLILLQSGVYLAIAITCNAGGLLHHRFILTKISFGGLLSVALSLGSPRVDVIHHFALRSPDFPLSKDSDCPINSFNY